MQFLNFTCVFFTLWIIRYGYFSILIITWRAMSQLSNHTTRIRMLQRSKTSKMYELGSGRNDRLQRSKGWLQLRTTSVTTASSYLRGYRGIYIPGGYGHPPTLKKRNRKNPKNLTLGCVLNPKMSSRRVISISISKYSHNILSRFSDLLKLIMAAFQAHESHPKIWILIPPTYSEILTAGKVCTRMSR